MITNIKDYKIIDIIGKGSYGTVYKVIKNKKYYALKMFILEKKENDNENIENIKSIENETKILSLLDSTYIVKLYDVFKEKYINNDVMCIIMELCENGDLNDLIKTKKQKNEIFTENEILQYFYEIMQGLTYLHSNKILHRDLKTMNIFLTKDNHIKIGDFGVSKKLINNNIYAYTVVGTPYYLSPEICQNKQYDEKSDIWSLGVLIYELITFNKPFDCNSQMGLFMKILKEKPAPIINTIKHTYSKKLINLIIDNLLDKNPLTRFSLRQIYNSGVFNKFFRKEIILQKQLNKSSLNKDITSKNKKDVNKNSLIHEKRENNINNDNNIIYNNKRVKVNNTFNTRVRINPLIGCKQKNVLSRRAQIVTVQTRSQNKGVGQEISLHEKHLQMNNKYLNTFKNKVISTKNKNINLEQKIAASEYLNDVLINDNYDLESNEETNYNKNNIDSINDIKYIENSENNTLNNNKFLININEDSLKKVKEEMKSEFVGMSDDLNKIKPEFMKMSDEIINNDLENYFSNEPEENEFFNINNLNTIENKEIQENDFTNINDLKNDENIIEDNILENKEEENKIPILEELNENTKLKNLENKEENINNLINKAYESFGKEIVDEILLKYEICKKEIEKDNTKELDELILNKLNNDHKKYGDFLEIFYQIIYIKYIKELEEQ